MSSARSSRRSSICDGEQVVGVGGAVFGLDDDEGARVAGVFAVAAAAVVGGGVHAQAEAGRAVDEDDVVVGLEREPARARGRLRGRGRRTGVRRGGRRRCRRAGGGAGRRSGRRRSGTIRSRRSPLAFACHVVGEAVAVHGKRLLAQLSVRWPCGSKSTSRTRMAEAGQVLECRAGRRPVPSARPSSRSAWRSALATRTGCELVGVFGEGLPGARSDGGLSDAALLVADDDAADDRRAASTAGAGLVSSQSRTDWARPWMRETPRYLAVGAEVLPQAGGQEGGEGLGTRGVDGRGVGCRVRASRDALFDGVLDVDAVLGGADLQFLAEPGGQLGDDLLAVAPGVR